MMRKLARRQLHEQNPRIEGLVFCTQVTHREKVRALE